MAANKRKRLSAAAQREIRHADALVNEVRRADGALISMASGLGTGVDPRSLVSIVETPDLTDDQLRSLLKASWQCNRVVCELPREALRKWIKLTVDLGADGDPDEGAAFAQQALDRMEELTARQKMKQALEYERGGGGALVVLGVGDQDDPSKPLDLEAVRVGKVPLRFLEVYSKPRIRPPQMQDVEQDAKSPQYGQPSRYYVRRARTGMEQEVHWTRCIVLQGWSPVERDFPWDFGIAVLNLFWPSFRDYETTKGHVLGIGARLVETRIRQKGLLDLLTGPPEKRASVRAAYEEMHTLRSVFKILLIDADSEIEDVQLSVAGYEKLVQLAREDLAAASGLSMQHFYGTGRTGLGDRDESGAERDDAAVKEYQEDRLRPLLNRLVAVVLASLGAPADATWRIDFVPLREETPTTRATRRKLEAETDHLRIEDEVVTREEVRASVRSDPESPYALEDEAAPKTENGAAEDDAASTGTEVPGDGAEANIEPGQTEQLTGSGIQQEALNGAQLTALSEIMQLAEMGDIQVDAARTFIESMFGLSPEVAAQLVPEPKKEKPRDPLALPGSQPVPPRAPPPPGGAAPGQARAASEEEAAT